MLDNTVQQYIDQSVLCWLATAGKDGWPNVSPKELFLSIDSNTLVIANIASPQSVRNIQQNDKVCVSFVDVFVQKGYQLKGRAQLIVPQNAFYGNYKTVFEQQFGDAFPMASFIEIRIEQVKPILAPSYQFFPTTEETKQVQNALKTYKVQALPDSSTPSSF